MARPSTVRRGARKTRTKSRRHWRIAKLWPSAALRRRGMHAFLRTPALVQVLIGLAVLVMLWFVLNWVYQVVRKPSELFFPVSGTLYKSPPETWREYAPIFEKHATNVMTAEFLAALAQVEGSGNPIVRTYWRWSLHDPRPFDMYRPASSAV